MVSDSVDEFLFRLAPLVEQLSTSGLLLLVNTRFLVGGNLGFALLAQGFLPLDGGLLVVLPLCFGAEPQVIERTTRTANDFHRAVRLIDNQDRLALVVARRTHGNPVRAGRNGRKGFEKENGLHAASVVSRLADKPRSQSIAGALPSCHFPDFLGKSTAYTIVTNDITAVTMRVTGWVTVIFSIKSIRYKYM